MTRPTRRTVLGAAAAAPLIAVAPGARAQDGGPPAPYGLPISPEFPFEKQRITVEGSEMAYVDEGSGRPVLFLHGNPTSSYLWRNVIPHVTGTHRAIAPDLIGMGDSDKPDIGYTFADHARHLDAFIDALDLQDIVLVVHDWGSALGMRHARRNPDRVGALAFMEAIVPPALPVPAYEAMPPDLADFFRLLRSPEGERLVLEENYFVEQVLPGQGVLRELTEAEMAAYRAPYPTPESRRPTLVWPRQIPIAGEPQDVVNEVALNGTWLYETDLPKLMFHAEPGTLAPPQVAAFMAANLANVEVRFLGAGTHFLQEEHPALIGQGLADWLRRL